MVLSSTNSKKFNLHWKNHLWKSQKGKLIMYHINMKEGKAMKHLIKADFKKITFLSSHRNYLTILCLLSISFGLIFLFTLGVTQEKHLTELPAIEVIDISLLGM